MEMECAQKLMFTQMCLLLACCFCLPPFPRLFALSGRNPVFPITLSFLPMCVLFEPADSYKDVLSSF